MVLDIDSHCVQHLNAIYIDNYFVRGYGAKAISPDTDLCPAPSSDQGASRGTLPANAKKTIEGSASLTRHIVSELQIQKRRTATLANPSNQVSEDSSSLTFPHESSVSLSATNQSTASSSDTQSENLEILAAPRSSVNKLVDGNLIRFLPPQVPQPVLFKSKDTRNAAGNSGAKTENEDCNESQKLSSTDESAIICGPSTTAVKIGKVPVPAHFEVSAPIHEVFTYLPSNTARKLMATSKIGISHSLKIRPKKRLPKARCTFAQNKRLVQENKRLQHELEEANRIHHQAQRANDMLKRQRHILAQDVKAHRIAAQKSDARLHDLGNKKEEKDPATVADLKDAIARQKATYDQCEQTMMQKLTRVTHDFTKLKIHSENEAHGRSLEIEDIQVELSQMREIHDSLKKKVEDTLNTPSQLRSQQQIVAAFQARQDASEQENAHLLSSLRFRALKMKANKDLIEHLQIEQKDLKDVKKDLEDQVHELTLANSRLEANVFVFDGIPGDKGTQMNKLREELDHTKEQLRVMTKSLQHIAKNRGINVDQELINAHNQQYVSL